MSDLRRRHFISTLFGSGVATLAAGQDALNFKGEGIQFGLCTYMWGADLDVPALITTLEKAKILGVELRVEHAHNVSPKLTPAEREEVRKRFEASPVDVVGMGTNFEFHSADADEVKKNIAGAKEYIKLSHDIGGSGVKVKPNGLAKDVPVEKTLAQIGAALAELGDYSLGFGQEIRLEVHGKETAKLDHIATIMKAADRDNVRVCWNSNAEDLAGEGLDANFAKVREHLGHTTHIRGATVPDYPWDKLAKLLVAADYEGWVLLEAHGKRPDGEAAAVLGAQRDAFMKLVSDARKAG